MAYDSKLSEISAEVFAAKDVDSAKAIITKHIQGSKIKESDKKKIVHDVSELQTLTRVHTYFCNSLLKYEGLSVN